MEGQKLKELVDNAEIGLVLDTYDDIFSDFDPRPYNERALSEDFLYEAKKAARDKNKGIELRFLIPKAMRNEANEELIKLRLKDHFKKHYKSLRNERSRSKRQAVLLIAFGGGVGLLDAILLSANGPGAIVKDAIEIILTPASWYTIWTGLDHLMIRPKDEVDDETFYRKMTDAQIMFTPY